MKASTHILHKSVIAVEFRFIRIFINVNSVAKMPGNQGNLAGGNGRGNYSRRVTSRVIV